MKRKLKKEVIEVPIEIGDTILTGKFKNKKTVVKTITTDEKGDIAINGKNILRVRVIKPKVESSIKKSELRIIIREEIKRLISNGSINGIDNID